MKATKIGSRREVCWDEFLIDTAQGVEIKMHKPQYNGVVLKMDEAWEGNGSGGYACVLSDGDNIRLYYRGFNFPSREREVHPPVWCLAESKDGSEFVRAPLNLQSFEGREDTNIIPMPEDSLKRGSLYIFRDTNFAILKARTV